MKFSDKHKQILALMADGKFHSGTELANILGISRSAIWKQLNGFTELGLSHIAVNGKGYRLERPLELLSKSRISEALSDNAKLLVASLEIHDQIPSTSNYLTTLAHKNAPSGTLCLAEYQTAGKGRRGRQWISPYGHNIYLSVLWRFQQGPAAISGLSLAIGVAVIRALKQLKIENVHLKWPNDIFCKGKKLGGILVEVSGENEGPCHAVVGLGLNIFLPDAEASSITQDWTDLTRINPDKTISRNQLATGLIEHLLLVMAEYEKLGIRAYLEEWRRYDCLKDKLATLYTGQVAISGIVKGIDDSGMLLIEHPDGRLQAFASGEVSFNPAMS